jgi:O-antigen/teichoic acid export membrane protein
MALMCHKVGYTVLVATDSLVLSKFVGLGAVGIYSNYSIITNMVYNGVNAIIGNATASIGNFNVEAAEEDKYRLYKRLQFLNSWINALCSGCLFVLINPFIINIWHDTDLIFSIVTVGVLAAYFYFNTINIILPFQTGFKTLIKISFYL